MIEHPFVHEGLGNVVVENAFHGDNLFALGESIRDDDHEAVAGLILWKRTKDVDTNGLEKATHCEQLKAVRLAEKSRHVLGTRSPFSHRDVEISDHLGPIIRSSKVVEHVGLSGMAF